MQLEPIDDAADDLAVSTIDPKLGPAEIHCEHQASSDGVGAAGKSIDRRYITAALMLVMVLASMEQTVTSTAMPTIIADLKGMEHYAWVASIYLLACTVSMPLYGRLADVLGRRVVILGAIAIFSVSSMAAASAHSMTTLIVFRGLQGLGAGGIMPVVLTILGDIFTLEERANIQGLFSAVWGTSSLAGPALGALLVRTLGWRSIFFVNLPFGAMGLAVLYWKYRDNHATRRVSLDLTGAAGLVIISMAALLLVSRVGPEHGPAAWLFPAGLLVTSVAAIAIFIWHERRADNPILPPWLITHRIIGTSLLGSGLLGICFLSLDTYVPLYVQGGRGGGATAAAAVVTPVMLTWALSGVFAAPMVVRLGFRRTARFGAVLIALGFTGLVLCAHFTLPRSVLTAVLAITGFGFGPLSMSYLLAAQDAVGYRDRGLVTSNIMFTRTIGGALGIGALGGLFKTLIAPSLSHFTQSEQLVADLMDPRLRQQISPTILHTLEESMCQSLTWVFIAMLAVAILSVAVTQRIPRRKSEVQIQT